MGIYLTDNRKGQLNMRRLIAAIISTAIILLAWNNAPDRVEVPDLPNPSTDGRYHTCGLITEEGVTEYLDIYTARCGPQLP